MQFQPHTRQPGERPQAKAIARSSEEPLSDWALVSLLGGVYLGGLGAFLGVVYAANILL
jgi:hypothetical protein